MANVAAAQQAGFKRALPMVSPDGQNGYIPFDRALDAQKAGFKVKGGAYISGMNSVASRCMGRRRSRQGDIVPLTNPNSNNC